MAEEISFIGGSQNCCVCFIDIVDSTRITAVEILDSEKIKIYYSVFINTMAAIVRNFDGTIIKNTGDSLIYYFPKTMGHVSDGNVTDLRSVFECGLTMLAVHPIMNVKLKEKGGNNELIIKGNNEYHFNMTDEYSIDSTSRNQYPIYSVFDKSQKNNDRVKMYENIV